jgi:hypothetical protein
MTVNVWTACSLELCADFNVCPGFSLRDGCAWLDKSIESSGRTGSIAGTRVGRASPLPTQTFNRPTHAATAIIMAPLKYCLAIVLAVVIDTAAIPASAQALPPETNPTASVAIETSSVESPATGPSESLVLQSPTDGSGGAAKVSADSAISADTAPNSWVGPNTTSDSPLTASHWFAGADFLFVRPHFSEATAFARGSQSGSGMQVAAQDLEFSYSPSFRVFAGYRFDGTGTELQFTYTRLTAHTENDAGNFTPGHFAVDPFGNIAGVAVVVDPNSALFGQPLVGGDHIQATADVDVNIFDLDLIKPFVTVCGGWELKYTAGVRVAQIHQLYQSTVTEGGTFFSGGNYSADFIGAGPRVGMKAERYFGACRQFSLFADTYGSILVGQYDMHFGQTTTAPAYYATQDTDAIRVLPVAEAEIGAGWSPIPWFDVSAGWLFQVWFDLGASGGNFGGFYTVTDNANIMAFEGLFVRAEVRF